MSRKGKRKLVLVGIICCLFLLGGVVGSYHKNKGDAEVSSIVP